MSSHNLILNRVADFIRGEKLLARGDRVLVACSGGIDSVVLLHLLRNLKLDLTLSIGHINHGLRGKESERDAKFVEQLARHFGIEFHSRKLKPGRQAQGPVMLDDSQTGPRPGGQAQGPVMLDDSQTGPRPGKGNLQDSARKLRIAELATWAGAEQASVATGHHSGDQLETVLFRMVRGTGPLGLGGIHPKKKMSGAVFIRPLLPLSRDDIKLYAKELKLKWVEDASNAGDKYERNRLRHNVVPHLEKLRPGLGERILHLQKILSLEEDYWSREVGRGLTQIKNGSRDYSLPAYQQLHPALRMRLLREMLPGVSYHHTTKLDALLMSSAPEKAYNLPGGRTFRKNYVSFSITS